MSRSLFRIRSGRSNCPSAQHRIRSHGPIPTIASTLAAACFFWPIDSRADEGGVSFWLPGQFGSLLAAPGTPGFSIGMVYYHTSVDAGVGRNFNRGGNVQVGLKANVDLGIIAPAYTFAEPFLGAQAAVQMGLVVGRNNTSVGATLTGPLGNQISAERNDARYTVGDLFPTATLKWNFGVHNVMTYVTGAIPLGTYEATRLSNVSLGHGAFDSGFGYTYFDPTKGHEFSAITGLTYNLKNPSTDYRNGVDWHVDLAASQFLSKQVHVGAVGYFYQQVTGDSGAGATLGNFRSRIAGVGPQIGILFPVGQLQGYLNLRGYGEFANQNRPKGWNMWLTFQISPASKDAAALPVNLVRK